jgi:predicted nucleic acid-binding protein
MTRKLLDTTVLIDLARGDVRAAAFVDNERQVKNDLHLPVISAMELIVGCRDKAEIGKMSRLIADFTVVDLTPTASRRAYDLIVAFSKSHGLVIPDALIAATALIEGIPLVTHNTKHFEMIPGLVVAQPY